ncbi:DNA mismatch repair protein PMS2 [Cryptococcus neoformans Tu401-1]|nr:DNA mismatch repair protein PMS2 [Cryptococcus neoformans var. grubii Tu401-1]
MTGGIKAIDTSLIHRIHSGQVVLDLQSAIKELLENSLDAGATAIDVRIKDNGLDSIEVVDNGSGIAEADWESVALRHHTSKLPSLEDLHKVTTFGFRGEALSALAALCDSITVVTATKETAPMGAVIKLGTDGRTIDTSGRVARPRGTTVTLSGLFNPLPVRRKEFERNAKKEVSKALVLLTAYALVPASASVQDARNGVRLKVELTAGGGRASKRNIHLMTDGRGQLRSSVGAVWGPSALDNVEDIDLSLEVEIDRLMARREGITERTQTVKVKGLISSAQWGCGFSTSSRQFFYINGRPCNLTKVARAVNEVYKSFNTNQLPLAILDFKIPNESVDINVSPDKRTIFVHSEDCLIDSLKTALESFFAPSRNTFTVEGASRTIKSIRRDHSHPSLKQSQHSQAISQTQQKNAGLEEQEGEHQVASDTEAFEDVIARRSLSRRCSQTTANIPSSPHEEQTKRSITSAATLTSSLCEPDEARLSSPSSQASLRQRTLSMSKPSLNRAQTVSVIQAPSNREAISKDRMSKLRENPQSSISQKPTVKHESDDETQISVDEGQEVMEDMSEDAGQDEGRNMEIVSPNHETQKVSEDEANVEAIKVEDQTMVRGSRIQDHTIKQSRHANKRILEIESSTDENILLPTRHSASAVWCGVDQQLSEQTPASSQHTLSECGRDLSSRNDPPPENRKFDFSTSCNPQRTSASSSSSPIAKPRVSQRLRSDKSYRDEIISTAPQGEVIMRFDLPRLRKRFANAGNRQAEAQNKRVSQLVKQDDLEETAGIKNKDSELAEEALSRVISKADFEKMEVKGQFNKGFIIARLQSVDDGTDDLFIIDQHASDEKYNFETLQQTTKIKAQALIKPRALHLTAGDEIIAMENIDILNANGFDVHVDENKPAGKGERISLLSMPVSKETVFDFKDLEQLLQLLSDDSRPSGQMVRPMKARAMFASRACRKSVMIGKTLTKGQMSQLLRNMGTIDQPWNCPHGRPTMRHLTKLNLAPESSKIKGRFDWTRWKEALG